MPYLVVAAIDFGTTYSGCAFSFRDEFKADPTKSFVKNWIDPNSSMMYCKTSTCILFNEEKEFSEFGFAAEAKFLDLMLENDHQNWYFFKRFKMALYELQVFFFHKIMLSCIHVVFKITNLIILCKQIYMYVLFIYLLF